MTTILLAFLLALAAQPSIPVGALVYVAPSGGFELYVKQVIQNKHIGLTLVSDKAQAEYEIDATDTPQSGEYEDIAAVKVINLKTGEMVLNYTSPKHPLRGQISVAELLVKKIRVLIK